MSSFRAWLQSAGLGNYADLLEWHKVDFDVLSKLSDEDLEKLGIPLGDRKRLLSEIAASRTADTTTAEGQETPGQEEEPVEHLRHLTVMFVDLVGSTSLSRALDVEDYRDVISQYHRCCTDILERYDGFVAQYSGDGVLAYFGYHRMLENDAEQAVLAGLAAARDVPTSIRSAGVSIQLRVGVATGDVLVNRPNTGEALSADTVFGDTPNLAARLQAVAEPSSVVVSSATRALLGNHFECTALGSTAIKGFEQPIQLFRVDRAQNPPSRFLARQRARMTTLIGRHEELSLLRKRWRSAAAGEGKVVFVAGEVGIGKSRLLEELHQELKGLTMVHLRYQCSPYHVRSAFHPIIAQLLRATGIEPDEPDETKLKKLERTLFETDTGKSRTLQLFARLLSIDPGGKSDSETANITGGNFHERIQSVLVEQLTRLAAQTPVLITFEDVHWIDPSSAELLSTLVHQIDRTRVLLVCTHRSEYSVDWIEGVGASKLHLNRLDRDETREMVELNAASQALDAETVATIAGRTEGVPLFIEEMTRAVVEAASRDAKTHGNSDAASQVLPATLNDLLAAKLDDLNEGNSAVATCAVLGRSFSYELLTSVSQLPEERLNAALDELVRKKVLVWRGLGRDPIYMFRHALIQEVAYKRLLRRRRRSLHARAAETISSRFPEMATRNPEVVAHHYTEAGMTKEAREAWSAAANVATERAAYIEAIAHLNAALEQNARLDDTQERTRSEIQLRERLVNPLEARFWGSEEIAENLNRLHELQQQHGDEYDQFAVLRGLCATYVIGARPDLGMGYALEMDELAERTGSHALKLMSRHALGMCHFIKGDFEDAKANYTTVIELSQTASLELVRQYFLADLKTVDRCMFAWASVLADPSDDDAPVQKATSAVEQTEEPFTRTYGLSILACIHQVRGEPRACRDYAREARDLGERFRFRYWEAWAQILLGWAEVGCDARVEGAARLERGIDAYRRTGAKQILPYARALLADAREQLGEPDAAAALLAELDRDSAFKAVHFHDPIVRSLRQRLAASDVQAASRDSCA